MKESITGCVAVPPALRWLPWLMTVFKERERTYLVLVESFWTKRLLYIYSKQGRIPSCWYTAPSLCPHLSFPRCTQSPDQNQTIGTEVCGQNGGTSNFKVVRWLVERRAAIF